MCLTLTVRNVLRLCLLVGVAALRPPSLWAGIEGTRHNLSASGPGPNKSSTTSEICVFCHTPHSGIVSQALWNQQMPPQTYALYTSGTLYSRPGQPTGSSRLCLSCHDGTTAMGSLRVPPSSGAVALWPLQGQRVLGTDLSDDHPISFVYDTALALRRGKLTDPTVLTPELPLDATGQLQCTTCHDPHENQHGNVSGNFVRMGIVQMCTSCHPASFYQSHGGAPSYWHDVCYECHAVHNAPAPKHLLKSSNVCELCHVYPYPGSSAAATTTVTSASSATSAETTPRAAKDLSADFNKVSTHPIRSFSNVHAPEEDPATMPRHVTCVDCHSSHQTTEAPSGTASGPGRPQRVSGVAVTGGAVAEVTQAYEVCFKCHGLADQRTPGIVRQDNTRNTRLELNPNNASYHPVAAVGKHPSIQGLQPGYTASSVLTCMDCHNSDAWTDSGTSPIGPHGSRFEPILEREYQQADPTRESFQSYALCYKCHTRGTLLSGGQFPHKEHLEEGQASCAVCHDAHGSRQSIRLINFMLRDQAGRAVVEQNTNGLIGFSATGYGHGECNLSCHGKNHDRARY